MYHFVILKLVIGSLLSSVFMLISSEHVNVDLNVIGLNYDCH